MLTSTWIGVVWIGRRVTLISAPLSAGAGSAFAPTAGSTFSLAADLAFAPVDCAVDFSSLAAPERLATGLAEASAAPLCAKIKAGVRSGTRHAAGLLEVRRGTTALHATIPAKTAIPTASEKALRWTQPGIAASFQSTCYNDLPPADPPPTFPRRCRTKGILTQFKCQGHSGRSLIHRLRRRQERLPALRPVAANDL